MPFARVTRVADDASAWILRVSESKANYWATYVVDSSLMIYCLAWDAVRFNVGAASIVGLAVAGLVTWTLSEYAFHRWVYHLGIELTRHGHEKHHEDPTAYLAMPWFISPLLFLPLQMIVSG